MRSIVNAVNVGCEAMEKTWPNVCQDSCTLVHTMCWFLIVEYMYLGRVYRAGIIGDISSVDIVAEDKQFVIIYLKKSNFIVTEVVAQSCSLRTFRDPNLPLRNGIFKLRNSSISLVRFSQSANI